MPCLATLVKMRLNGHLRISIASHDADCRAVITIASQAFVEDHTIKSIREAKLAFQKQGALQKLKKWHGSKAEWVLRAWTDVWLSPGFADWSLESYISRVTCPVLAIHCDNDEYGSIAFPEFITGKVGGTSEMQILQQCGHQPHRDYPQTVIETVKEFFNQHHILAYDQQNE